MGGEKKDRATGTRKIRSTREEEKCHHKKNAGCEKNATQKIKSSNPDTSRRELFSTGYRTTGGKICRENKDLRIVL